MSHEEELLRFLTSVPVLRSGGVATCSLCAVAAQEGSCAVAPAIVLSAPQTLGVLFPSLRACGATVAFLRTCGRSAIDALCRKCPMTVNQRMTLLAAVGYPERGDTDADGDDDNALTHAACPTCFPRRWKAATAAAGEEDAEEDKRGTSSSCALSRSPLTLSEGGLMVPSSMMLDSLRHRLEPCPPREGLAASAPLSFGDAAADDVLKRYPDALRWSSIGMMSAVLQRIATSASQQLRSLMFDPHQPFLSLSTMTSILVSQFGASVAQVEKLNEVWMVLFEKPNVMNNKKDPTGRWKSISHVSLSQVLEALDKDRQARLLVLRDAFARFTRSSPWYILASEVEEMKRSRRLATWQVELFASIVSLLRKDNRTNHDQQQHQQEEEVVLKFEEFVEGLCKCSAAQVVDLFPSAFEKVSVEALMKLAALSAASGGGGGSRRKRHASKPRRT